jgi:hypothetical protein
MEGTWWLGKVPGTWSLASPALPIVVSMTLLFISLRTMGIAWVGYSPPHVACSTRRDIHMSDTRPGNKDHPSPNRLISSPRRVCSQCRRGADRRPGRPRWTGQQRGTHRAGAHDAVAWARSQRMESTRRPLACACGNPSSSDTHGRADGPISDSSGCDHVKAPACVLRSALCYR